MSGAQPRFSRMGFAKAFVLPAFSIFLVPVADNRLLEVPQSGPGRDLKQERVLETANIADQIAEGFQTYTL
ncbi:MAG: hypothetical protein ACREHD_28440, partial [Pirellulales bacterium]